MTSGSTSLAVCVHCVPDDPVFYLAVVCGFKAGGIPMRWKMTFTPQPHTSKNKEKQME